MARRNVENPEFTLSAVLAGVAGPGAPTASEGPHYPPLPVGMSLALASFVVGYCRREPYEGSPLPVDAAADMGRAILGTADRDDAEVLGALLDDLLSIRLPDTLLGLGDGADPRVRDAEALRRVPAGDVLAGAADPVIARVLDALVRTWEAERRDGRALAVRGVIEATAAYHAANALTQGMAQAIGDLRGRSLDDRRWVYLIGRKLGASARYLDLAMRLAGVEAGPIGGAVLGRALDATAPEAGPAPR